MIDERQTAQEYFLTLLRTVVGQAFSAAGYELQAAPLQSAGGKFRFVKTLPDGVFALIDFQVLVYSDTVWSAGAPSRFKAQLTRSRNRQGIASDAPGEVTRGLSQLVVGDFGVAILPAADHWWSFHDTDSLGKALAEAGHLIVAYACPGSKASCFPQPMSIAAALLDKRRAASYHEQLEWTSSGSILMRRSALLILTLTLTLVASACNVSSSGNPAAADAR